MNGHLVLTRLPGQKIMIGTDIEVEVLGIKGNQVKVAVSAPKEVRVDREEVRARIVLEEASRSIVSKPVFAQGSRIG